MFDLDFQFHEPSSRLAASPAAPGQTVNANVSLFHHLTDIHIHVGHTETSRRTDSQTLSRNSSRELYVRGP